MDLVKDVKNGGYAFQMEIVIRAVYKGYKVEEVPITLLIELWVKVNLAWQKFSFILIQFQTYIKNYKIKNLKFLIFNIY